VLTTQALFSATLLSHRSSSVCVLSLSRLHSHVCNLSCVAPSLQLQFGIIVSHRHWSP